MKIKIKLSKIDEDEFQRAEYAHIIEIYDFPVVFKNENIMSAFSSETLMFIQ